MLLDPAVLARAPQQGCASLANCSICQGSSSIRRLGEDHYAVPASLIETGALSLSARFVRTAQGLEIRGVRAGSLVAALGLEAGDTLMALDGIPLTSLCNGPALYYHLRDAREDVELDVVRAGRHVAIRYRIDRDGDR